MRNWSEKMISNVEEKDFCQIYKIHKGSLPEDFLPTLSKKYLVKTFYPSMLNSNSLFLKYEKNKTIYGFLILIIDISKNNKFFLNPRTFFELLFQAFKLPKKIFPNALGILFSKTDFWLDIDKSQPEIFLIAVDIKYQKMGIGKELIDFGLAELKKQGYSKCIVKTDSDQAISFYRKNGFEEVGREKRYKRTLKILGRKMKI